MGAEREASNAFSSKSPSSVSATRVGAQASQNLIGMSRSSGSSPRTANAARDDRYEGMMQDKRKTVIAPGVFPAIPENRRGGRGEGYVVFPAVPNVGGILATGDEDKRVHGGGMPCDNEAKAPRYQAEGSCVGHGHYDPYSHWHNDSRHHINAGGVVTDRVVKTCGEISTGGAFLGDAPTAGSDPRTEAEAIGQQRLLASAPSPPKGA